MNKKILIIGIVIVIVIAGVIIATINKSSTESNNESTVAGNSTLQDLLAGKLGNSVTCDFSYPIGESTTLKGTGYFTNNKLRVDYQMVPPISGQSDLHLISDGEYNYIWGNSTLGNMFSGMKFKIEQNATTDELPSEVPNYIDYDMPLIDCQPWQTDQSLFNIPEDIEFTDINAMMDNLPTADQFIPDLPGQNESGEEMVMPTIDCSICEQLPPAQQADCRQSMGCQ